MNNTIYNLLNCAAAASGSLVLLLVVIDILSYSMSEGKNTPHTKLMISCFVSILIFAASIAIRLLI